MRNEKKALIYTMLTFIIIPLVVFVGYMLSDVVVISDEVFICLIFVALSACAFVIMYILFSITYDTILSSLDDKAKWK